MVAVGPDDAAEKAAWLSAVEAVIDQNGYCLGSAVETFENLGPGGYVPGSQRRASGRRAG